MRSLSVHFLPSLTTPEELAGGTVVVIDVLRASTTIVYALAAGAKEVIPCLEVEEAKGVAAKYPREAVLLGGERGGLKIDGFDLGNSPREYTPERVRGKTVVFTTTNGTRAMQMCRQASRVLVGASANLTALVEVLKSCEQVHLLCAGTDSHITYEDVFIAGRIAEKLGRGQKHRNDEAELAACVSHAWLKAKESTVSQLFRHSRGGRNLEELGQADDIQLAAQVDQYSVVPELDLSAWRITAG